jgi:uncharacterized protein (TIGR02117 family)
MGSLLGLIVRPSAWVAGCLFVAGFAPSVAIAQAGEPAAAAHTLHVIRRDGHTGIALRAADLAPLTWPAQTDLPQAHLYEVGWGDRDYYRDPDPGLWLGLKALLGSRPGVLHVVALEGPIEAVYGTTVGPIDVIEIALAREGLAKLAAAIAASHERDSAGRAVDLGPGHYGRSRFYGSNEPFGRGRTCNVWTAAMLQAAGVPLGEERPLTAGALMEQLLAIGRRIGPRVGAASP